MQTFINFFLFGEKGNLGCVERDQQAAKASFERKDPDEDSLSVSSYFILLSLNPAVIYNFVEKSPEPSIFFDFFSFLES